MKKNLSIFSVIVLLIFLITPAKAYNINIGDVLEIYVWQEPELSKLVTVDANGNISFPLIGSIEARGLDIKSLTELFNQKLSKHIKNPEVTITIKEMMAEKFYISGEIARPGEYTLDENTTLLKAISKAGGHKEETADLTSIFIIKKDTRIGVNLKKFLLDGDSGQNIGISADDIIYIPKISKVTIEKNVEKIYILGEVKTPGEYILDRETSLIKAIAKAGGYKDETADLSAIFIIRKDDATQKEIRKEINLKQFILSGDTAGDAEIKNEDIIYLPKVFKKVYVLGEVKIPGVYNLEDDAGIIEAITYAGGYKGESADMKRIMVVRRDAIEKATSTVDLGKFIEMGDPYQNMPIKKGDIVYVPKSSNKVYILGEINSPGVYSLDDGLSAIEIISRAGGFKTSASLKSVMLIRKNNEGSEPSIKKLDLAKAVDKGLMEDDIALITGDVVYVPKKFIAKVGDFVKFFFTDINPVLDTYLKVYEAAHVKERYDYYKRANP
ncbi:MAG: SLBB domain-containing protein [bacterium]